nr:PREDICTED: vasculin-like isoform X2 [Haliaeetus albicilla]
MNLLVEDDESFNLRNSNSPHHERDINRNFENEIPQENGNASITSQQVIRSSAFPRADVLSSSLEAEHRLLKEMGWQEDCENDETCAPLTEDEMREFRVISEQEFCIYLMGSVRRSWKGESCAMLNLNT